MMSFNRDLCIGLAALALSGCQGETFSQNGDKEIVEGTDVFGRLVEKRTYHAQLGTLTIQSYEGDIMREEEYSGYDLTGYEINKK